MIEVSGLVKRYPAVVAVSGVSFRIEKGEVVGFLGPNGAGKTTIMRILSAFIPATAGKATVGGYDVFRDSMAVRRIIGYLPENVPLYPEMRVTEYLNFRAKIKEVPGRERSKRVGWAMDRCDISEVASRPIRHLSKGYRQRVGLADALVHDPPVLILDEPTIGLDPNQIRQVRSLIKNLGEDRTVVLSTHILPEVEMICRRFLIIDSGRIVADNTIENLGNSASVVVRFSNAAEGTGECLRSLNGVKKVEFRDGRFVLDVSGQDVEAELFKMCLERHLVVTELKRVGTTLEDVFVSATMKDMRNVG
jgi:ABC-2 type transport system ATP-binding protein